MPDAPELRGLGETGLAALVGLRPDACRAPVPQSLQELAERLATPPSVVAALQRLDLPTLQVAEAVAALGGQVHRPGLGRLLGAPPADPGGPAAGTATGGPRPGGDREAAIERALDTLRQYALLSGRPVPVLEPAAVQAFPEPLGLGPPLAQTLAGRAAEELRGLARNLGLAATGRKAETLAAVTRALNDPDLVRRVVAAAPAPLPELLTKIAFTGDLVDDDAFGVTGQYPAGGYHTATGYGRRTPSPLHWALSRGLLARDGEWSGVLVMPAEVALALRECGYTAPFDPDPPVVRWRAVAEETVTRDATATGSAFVGLVTALLTEAGRTPIAVLRAGGVGLREQRRLATRLGCGLPDLRLALALAHAGQLLGVADGRLVPSAECEAWLRKDPPSRLEDLLRTWWRLPYPPLIEDGTFNPAVYPGTTALRQVLLAEAAGHHGATLDSGGCAEPADHDGHGAHAPAGTVAAPDDPAALYPRVAWRLPVGTGDPQSRDARAAACWREAGLLGVVAAGAVSAAGRALLDGGDLTAALGGIGAAQRTVLLQADLTAVVTGTPAADLIDLLDSVADQETRGTASTWRFTPASVRRALDAGHTAEQLLDDLAAVATAALPQPLRYLVADVARRHGAVRVSSVACCLRSDDTALLAEIAADRRLRALGLRLLAPTVLASTTPLPDTLTALRKAGHAPVIEDDDGTVVREQPATHRAPAPRQRGVPPARQRGGPAAGRDRPAHTPPERAGTGRSAAPAAAGAPGPGGTGTALARTLLAAPDGARMASTTLTAVRAAAPQLSNGEARILAHAIDAHQPVAIGYVNRDGNASARVISDIELAGGTMTAYCHLRDDVRWFSPRGLLTVQPATENL